MGGKLMEAEVGSGGIGDTARRAGLRQIPKGL